MKWIYLITISLLITACSKKENRHPNKKILRYNESAGISHLDPAHAQRFEDIWAMSQLYNGLVRLDEDMNVSADVAKDWKVDSSYTVYTFHLRTDVYFHDHQTFKNGKGRRVIAQDFINSFQRISDPDVGSQGKFIFRNLDRINSGNGMGMKAPNDSTLVIYLKKPQFSFLKMLTLPFCYVVPIEVVDYYGEDFTRNPVGSGPFAFRLWHQGEKLVFVKNQNYHEVDEEGNSLPYIDAVSISFIASRATEFSEFTKGNLDFISGIDDSYQNSILTETGELHTSYSDEFYMIKQPWLKTDYIGILVDESKDILKNSPLRKRDVRRAINYAIDKKRLVAHVRSGIGVPAYNGFVPAGINDYNGKKVKGYSYDPQKVKEYLFTAGYTGENERPKVTLVAANNYKLLCEYIMRDLNENGFDVKVDIMLPTLQKQAVSTFQTNFFRKSWTADFPDPINFLNLFHSKNFAPEFGPNYTHFSHPQFDTWMQRAEQTRSSTERQELYYKMDEMITDEAVVVPLFYDEIVKFVNKRVSGLRTNPMNQLDLKYVELD